MQLSRVGLLAALALFASGCGAPAVPSNDPSAMSMEDPPAPAGTPRLLALGDSYTIGESVNPDERWPVQLVANLKQRGIELAQPTIIARTGWTTGDLLAALERVKPAGPYAVVTLLIGVNNQFRGRSIDEYRTEFVTLLKRAIDLAGGNADHVVVLSIPDWGVMPFALGQDRAAIAAAIDRFNEVNQAEAKKAGARYVEITVGSRRAASDPDLVARDGLHPSAKMYADWAAAALPAVEAALTK